MAGKLNASARNLSAVRGIVSVLVVGRYAEWTVSAVTVRICI